MEKVLEQALPKQVTEIQEALPVPTPVTTTSGGFPWVGSVIVVAVVAAAVLGRKLCKK